MTTHFLRLLAMALTAGLIASGSAKAEPDRQQALTLLGNMAAFVLVCDREYKALPEDKRVLMNGVVVKYSKDYDTSTMRDALLDSLANGFNKQPKTWCSQMSGVLAAW
jgi:hypothetical protein